MANRRVDAEPSELKTFVFEVSAGCSAGASAPPVGGKNKIGETAITTPKPSTPPAIVESDDEVSPAPKFDDRQLQSPSKTSIPPKEWSAIATPRRRASRRTDASHKTINKLAGAPSKTAAAPVPKRSTRRLAPWWASLGVHGAAVAVLAVATIAGAEKMPDFELSIGPEVAEHVDVEHVEFASDVSPELVDHMALSNLVDPGEASPEGLSIALPSQSASGAEQLLAGGFGELHGLGGMGLEQGGLSTFGDGLGSAPTAEFFGARIEGRRIVFVLDNSGSMQAGRLETVIAELETCIESLNDEQRFYVVFYSDAVYPLFYPDPIAEFIRPTEENRRELSAWLRSVELCLGDAVLDAMNAAAAIDPDAVVLLSDGRIYGARKMQALLGGAGGRFPVHTVGVGLGNSETSRRNLQEIAAANGGEFREADVPEDMRLLARRQPRPYHVDRPGEIWGRSVKVRMRRDAE